MRATELLGCTVYDADGEVVGHVHDLRFDPLPGSTDWTGYRLTALACGDSAAVGHRLGYGHRDMAGPWPLTWIFRRRGRKARLVAWSDVTSFERPRIEISRRRGDLGSAIEDAS
jgi:hypothetical protein